jgi:hypothetical protein
MRGGYMRYKLIDITEFAKKHLSVEDENHLKDMIGCEIIMCDERNETDNAIMYIMPDGNITHECFLIVEQIN